METRVPNVELGAEQVAVILGVLGLPWPYGYTGDATQSLDFGEQTSEAVRELLRRNLIQIARGMWRVSKPLADAVEIVTTSPLLLQFTQTLDGIPSSMEYLGRSETCSVAYVMSSRGDLRLTGECEIGVWMQNLFAKYRVPSSRESHSAKICVDKVNLHAIFLAAADPDGGWAILADAGVEAHAVRWLSTWLSAYRGLISISLLDRQFTANQSSMEIKCWSRMDWLVGRDCLLRVSEPCGDDVVCLEPESPSRAVGAISALAASRHSAI